MRILIYILLLFITVLPKITIISVNNSVTGIRGEDFILFICAILLLFFSNKKSVDTQEDNMFNKIKKIMYIYLVASSLSTLYGLVKGYIAPVTSFLFLIRKLEYFVLFYIGYYYGGKENRKEGLYLDLIVVFHFIMCILQMNGILGSFNHGEMLTTLTQGRVSSTFNGAYEMSAFLLLILPFYINNILIDKKNILKSFLFSLIITFCIIISYSRTSLIIECIIFIYILKKSNILKSKKKLINAILIFAFALVPLFVYFVQKIDLSRFYDLTYEKTSYIIKYTWQNRDFDTYVKTRSWYGTGTSSLNQIDAMGYDASLYQRCAHWMQLIDGWFTSPIIGCGVSLAGNAADGNYIKIMTETGLLGIGLWIYLLVIIYKSLKNSKWIKYSFITLVVGALFIDLFDSSKVIMMFWFLLGVYLRRQFDETKKSSSN